MSYANFQRTISYIKVLKISNLAAPKYHHFLCRIFFSNFEHPTLQGALLIDIIPRALPWAKSFCPFRACCFYELLPFTFALPFGQRFSIPLRAGDRWFWACGAKLAKLVSIRFHIRYFLDLPLSMCSYVKFFL